MDRNCVVNVRLSDTEYTTLLAKATEIGAPLSTFLRIAALVHPSRAAPKIVQDKTAIECALAVASGNMDKAARALGCARRTLQSRMRDLGMAAPMKAGRPRIKLQ